MGTICSGEGTPQQISELQMLSGSLLTQDLPTQYHKKQVLSVRFGEIQRIRAATVLRNNMYKFIIPIRDSEQFIRIQVPIISSYADQFSANFPLLSTESIQFNPKFSLLIDYADTKSNKQLYFNFIKNDEAKSENFLVKVYNYKNYRDPQFIAGLYEAALYKSLDNYINGSYWLRDFFFIEKGNNKSMVFVTNMYVCTLNDILIYRKKAKVAYTVEQQVYITLRILKSYKKLQLNNIIHRDIRPSKVYLFDGSQKNYDISRLNQSYELINLQSARKFTKSQLKQMRRQGYENNRNQMLMTVRGIPKFSSQQVIEHHNNDNQMGVYNYETNQRNQLAKTIETIALCDPLLENSKKDQIKKSNKVLQQTIKKLQSSEESLDDIIKNLENIFDHKMKKKIVTLTSTDSILQYDNQIAKAYLPSLLYKTYKQRIQQASTQCLFSLHRQNQFSKKLQKMMDINDQSGKQMENVAILDRLGCYYEGLGAKNNDYFKEQIEILLIILAKNRINGFPSQPYLQKINETIQNRIPVHCLKSQTKLKILIEQAYAALNQGDAQKSQNSINQAMVIGSQSNIEIQTQLDLIQCKCLVQLQFNNPQDVDQFYEKGLQLSNNRNNFITEVKMLNYKSTFQYLAGLCYMKKSKQNDIRIMELKKYLSKTELYFNQAKKIKSDIPQNSVVPLGKVFEGIGQMNFLRQNYQQGISSYERATKLYESSDEKVHESLILQALQRIQKIYQNNLQNIPQQNKIQQRLKKYRKSIVKNIDPRKNFEKIKYLSKKRQQSQVMKKSWLNEQKKDGIFEEIAQQNQDQQRSMRDSESNYRQSGKKSKVRPYRPQSLDFEDIIEQNNDNRYDQ